MKMDKSDKMLSAGSVLITVSLIMWETFGMMITPTVLTVAAAGCFVAAAAVRGGGRADAQQEKKKALNRPKYQRQNKTTRL